jgi:hypothetical protein
MTGDGKIREHTFGVGTRMTWLAIALKFYNIVVWVSFTGSGNVDILETRVDQRESTYDGTGRRIYSRKMDCQCQ